MCVYWANNPKMTHSLTTNNPWLMLGDCLEQMKKIPDSTVDMVLCDLPYGVTRNPWDSIIPLEPLWNEYYRAHTFVFGCFSVDGLMHNKFFKLK